MRQFVAARGASSACRACAPETTLRAVTLASNASEQQMGLPWLVRLRWVAIAGQVAIIVVARFVLGAELPMAAVSGLVALAIVSNAALGAVPAKDGLRAIGPTLLNDTLILTVLLWWTGGPTNPFGVVYLVYVTLAAVLATPRWTWATVATAVISYGFLFFSHLPLPGASRAHGAPDAFSAHLEGMWVAFALAACLIAWFVTRVREALAVERERSTRAARLVGLTTLAAGAAHELRTPLATIKIAAAELERALASHIELAPLLEDARLVRAEVERSRAVLDRLSAGSGELAGEAPTSFVAGALVEDALIALGSSAARVEVGDAPGDRTPLHAPRRALAQAIVNLVRNALDASPADARIELAVEPATRGVRFVVRDRGTGIAPELVARIGEPFLTTKPTGAGMGLGVFLVRSLADQLGGVLTFSPRSGGGTLAVLEIPDGAT